MSTVEDAAATDSSLPARRPPHKALLGWLVVLAITAILGILAWPKLAAISVRNSATTTPVAATGGPVPPSGASAPGARPKKPTYEYPPCTVTRTDRCVQKDD